MLEPTKMMTREWLECCLSAKTEILCAGGDSHPQALRHTHLKRARIPVPPPALKFIIQELLFLV